MRKYNNNKKSKKYFLEFNVQISNNNSINIKFDVKKNIYDLLSKSKQFIQSFTSNTITISDSFFCSNTKVQDETRYYFEVKDMKLHKQILVNESVECRIKTIVLLLESPHISEYRYNKQTNSIVPIRPANGMKPSEAGGAIENYFDGVIQKIKLSDGRYYLKIVNPIQYQTSLASIHGKSLSRYKKTLRNKVWMNIWKYQDDNKNFIFQNEFINRIQSYKPYLIINACTSQLKNNVSELLKIYSYTPKEIYHPAYNWCRKRY